MTLSILKRQRLLRASGATGFLIVAAMGVVIRADAAAGATVRYQAIPAQSIITLSGKVLNDIAQLQPQRSGSLSDPFTGMLAFDKVGTSLTFSGESRFDAMPSSATPLLPAGSGEDNFGGTADIFVTKATMAARNVEFTVKSGTATFGQPANNLQLSFTSGHVDYILVPSFLGNSGGKLELVNGSSAANAATALLSRAADEITETVTLPIKFTAYFKVYSANDTELTFTGSIVASRLLADFNFDRHVDGADLLAWQQGNGLSSGAAASQGDVDDDSDVDAADLSAWAMAFGASPSSSSAGAAAPEPSGMILALGLAALAGNSRRSVGRAPLR